MARPDVAEAICQAVETIVSRRLSQAGYDKTVRCTVQECLDKEKGRYRVKYAGVLYTAFAPRDVSYDNGTEVYMLIPENDWTQMKSIIGSVNRSASQTGLSSDDAADSAYNNLGPNVITNMRNSYDDLDEDRVRIMQNGFEFKMNSYDHDKNSDRKEYVLYKWQGQGYPAIGEGYINTEAVKYLNQGDCLVLGAKIEKRMNDKTETQTHGNYGIQVVIAYQDLEKEEESFIYKTYTLSALNTIPGNIDSVPLQYFEHIFYEDIDLSQLKHIESVIMFTQNFPQVEEPKFKNDIRIREVVLKSAATLSQEARSDYSVNISYPQGTVVGKKTSEKKEITLTAEFKKNGALLTQDVKYYWFRENGLIQLNSEGYHKLGGVGWECLNPTKQGTLENQKSLARKGDNLIPTGADITAAATSDDFSNGKFLVNQNTLKIKCVVVYNNIPPVTGYLLLTNNAIETNISIKTSDKLSDQTNRTVYYHGIPKKKPFTLACYVNNERKSEYSYVWTIVQNNESTLVKDVTSYVYNNFPLSSIVSSATVYCAVKNKDVYLGTASITLYNTNQTSNSHKLIIENGDQVFQYDEDGVSPAAESKESKVQVKPLTFHLLDTEGNEITHNDLQCNGAEAYWTFPSGNSMIKYRSSVTGYTCNFTILDKYNTDYTNNTIRLELTYKNVTYDAYTNFSFVKNGDIGTNGTQYVSKIVPQNSSTQRLYITNRDNILHDDSNNPVDKLLFKLYNNGETIEIDQDDVITRILKVPNDDTILEQGKTWLNVGKKGKIPAYQTINNTQYKRIGTNPESNPWGGNLPCNIIRKTYKLAESGLNYFAELPINICELNGENNDFRLKIQPGTGYWSVKYKSDGTSPSYRIKPFTVKVQEYTKGGYIDYVGQPLSYYWFAVGNNLQINQDQKYNITCTVTPKFTFDGLNNNNAICVIVRKTSTNHTIGYLHIPIYMYLNRYSNQALNDWDGNSIELGDENGGSILAPQIGAGEKNKDNQFTGVVMGKEYTNTKDSSGNDIVNVGLFGYANGARSIFLDAKTGKAEFGPNNAGKIIIEPNNTDPNNPRALIHGGQFYNEKGEQTGQGMLINLTTPQIRFGTGNFSVNKNGYLIAKGGGSIAGWKIGNTALKSSDGNVGLGAVEGQNNNFAFWAGKGYKESRPFWVTHEGEMKAVKGSIGGWELEEGKLKGKLGNDGGIELNSNGSLRHTKDKWEIKQDGQAVFKKLNATGGTIGGIQIGTEMISGNNWSIYKGGAEFKSISLDGNGLKVNPEGGLYITINSGESGGSGIPAYVNNSKQTLDGYTKLVAEEIITTRFFAKEAEALRLQTAYFNIPNALVSNQNSFSFFAGGGDLSPCFSIYPSSEIHALVGNSGVYEIGISCTVEFSDDTWLKFRKGILTAARYTKSNGEIHLIQTVGNRIVDNIVGGN